jgi:hypothetical protein
MERKRGSSAANSTKPPPQTRRRGRSPSQKKNVDEKGAGTLHLPGADKGAVVLEPGSRSRTDVVDGASNNRCQDEDNGERCGVFAAREFMPPGKQHQRGIGGQHLGQVNRVGVHEDHGEKPKEQQMKPLTCPLFERVPEEHAETCNAGPAVPSGPKMARIAFIAKAQHNPKKKGGRGQEEEGLSPAGTDAAEKKVAHHPPPHEHHRGMPGVGVARIHGEHAHQAKNRHVRKKLGRRMKSCAGEWNAGREQIIKKEGGPHVSVVQPVDLVRDVLCPQKGRHRQANQGQQEDRLGVRPLHFVVLSSGRGGVGLHAPVLKGHQWA